MRSRYLPLTLPAEVYKLLERQAEANERTEIQEVRYLLRLALLGQFARPLAEIDLTVLAGVGSAPDPSKAA